MDPLSSKKKLTRLFSLKGQQGLDCHICFIFFRENKGLGKVLKGGMKGFLEGLGRFRRVWVGSRFLYIE